MRLPEEKIKYAAHGGLVIITKAPHFLPSRIYTTMTVGQSQFTFFFVLTRWQVWEMRLRYPDFIKRCAEVAQSAVNEPIPPSTLQRLGL
jgi:hypothetical protein